VSIFLRALVSDGAQTRTLKPVPRPGIRVGKVVDDRGRGARLSRLCPAGWGLDKPDYLLRDAFDDDLHLRVVQPRYYSQ
jgi:hypothetical protein